jgi:hypothetical protein
MKWTRTEFLFLCNLCVKYNADRENIPDIVFTEHQKHYDRTDGALKMKIKEYVYGKKQHRWQSMGDRQTW